MTPKVSVLIPVYNTERFLSYCLDSVIQQTLGEIEIICVEDASTDHSGIILKRYAARDSRIRIIWHEKNAGLVKSRKDAVLSAQGKYIMFLDSDDELFPHACEVAYKAIENNKTDAVRFGVQKIDSRGLFKETGTFLQTERLDRVEDKNWLYLYQKELIKGWTVWNKIYDAHLCKTAYRQMEDGYIVMAEDVYFSFVYGYFAKSFSIIEDVLHKYRQGFGIWSGIQKSINLEKYRILLSEKKVLDALLRFYETKPNANEYELIITKHVRDAFLRHSVLWWHKNLPDQDKAAGLQIFAEIWGSANYPFAIKCLSENLSNRIQNLEKAKERLQKDKAKLQDDKAKLLNDKTKLQNDKAKLQNDKERLQKEKTKLQIDKAKLLNDKTKLQNDKAKLQNDKERLQKELSVIKESRGYNVLKKYYKMRDMILK